MPEKKLQTVNLLADLKTQIALGDLNPGQKLPSQRGLSERYGLARSTVREVFGRLHAEGYISMQQGAASRCCNLLQGTMDMPLEGVGDNLAFQLQVLEVRAELEAQAAKYASLRATEQQLEALSVEFERMQQRAREGDTTLAKAKADLRFHMMIAESSHHLLLMSFSQIFYSRYFNAIYGVLNRTLIRNARYPDGIRLQHEEIHQAIQQRNASRAEQVARDHILFTRKLLEQNDSNL